MSKLYLVSRDQTNLCAAGGPRPALVISVFFGALPLLLIVAELAIVVGAAQADPTAMLAASSWVVVPAWGLLIAEVVFAAAASTSRVLTARRSLSRRGKCAACGYDLSGLEGSDCPECGPLVCSRPDRRQWSTFRGLVSGLGLAWLAAVAWVFVNGVPAVRVSNAIGINRLPSHSLGGWVRFEVREHARRGWFGAALDSERSERVLVVSFDPPGQAVAWGASPPPPAISLEWTIASDDWRIDGQRGTFSTARDLVASFPQEIQGEIGGAPGWLDQQAATLAQGGNPIAPHPGCWLPDDDWLASWRLFYLSVMVLGSVLGAAVGRRAGVAAGE